MRIHAHEINLIDSIDRIDLAAYGGGASQRA
jgi:hypothetical protein